MVIVNLRNRLMVASAGRAAVHAPGRCAESKPIRLPVSPTLFVGLAAHQQGPVMPTKQMPEMTSVQLVAEIIKRFKRVPSCSDIRAERIQIVPIKAKGTGPNWTANIDLPMSDLAKMEAKAVIDGVRGRRVLKKD